MNITAYQIDNIIRSYAKQSKVMDRIILNKEMHLDASAKIAKNVIDRIGKIDEIT